MQIIRFEMVFEVAKGTRFITNLHVNEAADMMNIIVLR